MDGGTQVDDACLTEYNNIKLNKKYRYIIFALNASQQIHIEKLGDRNETYDDFVNALPANEARYAVYDYEFHTTDTPPRHVQRLVFFFWSPDSQKVQSKMTYATGKEALKKKLTGLQKEVQANGKDDLEPENVQKQVQ